MEKPEDVEAGRRAGLDTDGPAIVEFVTDPASPPGPAARREQNGATAAAIPKGDAGRGSMIRQGLTAKVREFLPRTSGSSHRLPAIRPCRSRPTGYAVGAPEHLEGVMQRGSDRMSAHRDEEMKHELQGLLRSGHPTRSDEWHDPEPTADDDPEVWRGAVVPGDPRTALESTRLELARYLGRGQFPATPSDLVRALRDRNAPDPLVEAVGRLPRPARYANAERLAEALARGAERTGRSA